MRDPLPLAFLPTPLEAMARLTEALGGPRLLVKRDDQTGLALGGNKVRKLERLCADARATRCDVLVTGGGTQSNHARLTAAAACRLGFDCHLLLGGSPPDPPTGNVLLDRLLGAEITFVASDEYAVIEAAIHERAEALRAAGRRPYEIPVGGASTPGVVAYADAADELLAQDPDVDWVVVADGSGGTHAGLLAGLGERARVVGVDVGTRPGLDDEVPRMAAAAAAATGRASPAGPVVVDHDHVGGGYGVPSAACVDAMRTAARLEGLVLDPVYTGKAMAALLTWVREGRFTSGETVVLLHTGGAPALFARRYADVL